MAAWWVPHDDGHPEMWIFGSAPSANWYGRIALMQVFRRVWESLRPSWQIRLPMQAMEVSNVVFAAASVSSIRRWASLAVQFMTYIPSSGDRRISVSSMGSIA